MSILKSMINLQTIEIGFTTLIGEFLFLEF